MVAKRERVSWVYVICCAYILIQVLGLFLLRRFFLLTVYQTAAAYAAISLVGIVFLFVPAFVVRLNVRKIIEILRDCYLLFWSGVHAVIVLGFLTCGSFYLTLTQVTIVQIVNIFLGIVLYWVLYLIMGRISTAVGCGNLLIAVIGTINFYLVRFRGAPFQLSDIKALRTAITVADGYDFTPNVLLVSALADLALWFAVWYCCGRAESWNFSARKSRAMSGKSKWYGRWNLISIFITAILTCGCIALSVMRFDDIYFSTMQFWPDTYLARILAEAMGSSRPLPEDYSADRAEQVIADFRLSQNAPNFEMPTDMILPNIVVIMNESFADLRVLGQLNTEEPMMPFWDSLEDNVIRGWANVSVLGGSTANSEYEFLTSDPVAVYPNSIPYNNYFDSVDTYPSLVSVLKALGYHTVAFHPYHANGWNRLQVYRAMQFEKFVFINDLEKLERLRLYVSDAGDYSYIEKCFQEKESGEPLFFFNVTMQNHGGYNYSGNDFQTTVQLSGDAKGSFPMAEQYLSLIRASDQALEDLLNWFMEYEEPVIVVMFGDHQPKLEDGFYEYITGQSLEAWDIEQLGNQYKTPFVIWHNYPAASADIGDVSLNYLAPLMLLDAGLPMSEYQQYVLKQYETMPVINGVGIWDEKGHFYSRGSEEFALMSSDYRMLTYYHTADKEYHWNDFFFTLPE